MAEIGGTIGVPGLAAPVRVVRDTWGVPHIYAASQDDLFIAQGFVQAQDRLFQMDLWRRSAQGRLSEVLGPNFIERDAMTRRMQYRGDLSAEWASYGPEAKAIAEAFVRGVNGWVALARERPPEEFALAGWKPETWVAADLLNRTDAFASSGDALDEVFRARLVAAVGAVRARELLPGDRGLVVPAGLDAGAVPDLVADAIRRVGTPPFFLGLAAPVIDGTVRLKPDTTDASNAGNSSNTSHAGIGSGSVRLPTSAPGASAGGQPDRELDNPSRRYLVHLIAPGWNVIGATAPWRPGVTAGHNEHLAWSGEPLDADTQDVFVEKLNPENPRQVDDRGRWVDIETSHGGIAVRGRKAPVDFTLETTRHGVIVASDLSRHLAFAIRWTGSEPGAVAGMTALAIDRATAPASLRGGPQTPGRRGWNGGMPAPGWNSATEWSDERTSAGLSSRFADSPPGEGARALLEYLRRHSSRGDALLQSLTSANAAPNALTAQRAAIVDALADALRDRTPPADGPVLFAHPLAVTDAARRRFNVSVRGSGMAADPLGFAFDPKNWDQSTAINAPGQSGSPASAHFADLAALWSQGKRFPLAFSEQAVQAHAEATLILTPR